MAERIAECRDEMRRVEPFADDMRSFVQRRGIVRLRTSVEV